MKKTLVTIVSVMLVTSLLGACTHDEKHMGGIIGGGVVGGVVGGAVTGGSAVGVGVGAVGGAVVGHEMTK